MFKDLLVNISVRGRNDCATAYAIALAAAFDAHATGVAFAYEPIAVSTMMGDVPVAYIDSQRMENERAATSAKERFDRAAALAGIAADSHVLPASVAGASDTFGRMARCTDVSIVMQMQPDDAGPEELIAEAALFQSGRPVIIVPYIHTGVLKTDRIMVCWDGSRTAARAVADAMPLLGRARQVEVVTVAAEEGKRDALPGADIGEHLARHGLRVEVKNIVAQGDVSQTLLSHAADMSADLVVMGGYGHSRLREFILGGATRTMLESMTVPCFMSH